ncbi:MAG: DUF222 domain-containing protein [Acidimicrobiia bacterium]
MSGTVLVESDGFVYLDAADLAEGEVRRLEAHIRRLRGRQAELLAQLDQHQVFHVEGARTMADWVSATLDLSPQASARLMTAARTELPQVREKMLAGEWGIDRAAVVAKLAAAGLPADELLETADTFSLGRLYGCWRRPAASTPTRRCLAISGGIWSASRRWTNRSSNCGDSSPASTGKPAPGRCVDVDLSRFADRHLCGLSPGGSRGDYPSAARGRGRGPRALLRGPLVRLLSSAASPPTSVGGESRYRVQPHHILERQHGGDHHPNNLVSLCWYHHHVAIHQRGMIIDPDSPTHRRKFVWPNHSPPDTG